MRRRNFLKSLPLGLAGAALVERVSALEGAVAESLETLAQHSATSRFDEMRAAYALSPRVTYFNHGSIGTIPKFLIRARQEYLELCESNPWLYMWGGDWEEPREETRGLLAQLIDCGVDEVAITHNTTEGFNILAGGLPLGPGDEVLFSSINHPGASLCWDHYGAIKGFRVKRFRFPIGASPTVDDERLLEIYDSQITPRTRVLVFPHIDNMVGIRHPMQQLTALAKAKGVEFVAVDGAQSVGMLPVHLRDSGVDFYASSPHKWLQAPKGLGLLYVRKEAQPELKPIWVTWGQSRWKGTARIYEDYGTRNLAEVLVLGRAVELQIRDTSSSKEERYRSLWRFCKERVDSSSHLEWLSPRSWPMSSSLYSVRVRGVRSSDVFKSLYEGNGFVFRAFGSDDFDAIRLSLAAFNTEEEINRFVSATAGLA